MDQVTSKNIMPQTPERHSHRMLAVIIIGVIIAAGLWWYMMHRTEMIEEQKQATPKTPTETLQALDHASTPVVITPATQAKGLSKLKSMSKKVTTPTDVRITTLHKLHR